MTFMANYCLCFQSFCFLDTKYVELNNSDETAVVEYDYDYGLAIGTTPMKPNILYQVNTVLSFLLTLDWLDIFLEDETLNWGPWRFT